MNKLIGILVLVTSYTLKATVITVGNDVTCSHSNLQLAIDDSFLNGDTMNEIRLVNDGSFNHLSFVIRFIAIKNLTLVGGFANCTDASNNILTDKTTIDAQDIIQGQPIFSVTNPINNFQSRLTLENLILTGSHAVKGGALYMENLFVTINNSDFHNNRATDGGAIYCESNLSTSGLIIDDVILTNNHATNHGGAIFVNTQENSGAGCYTVFSSTQRQTQLSHNSANGFGGGIYVSDYGNELLFSEISANQGLYGLSLTSNSASKGGAIYQLGGVSILRDTEYLNNQASLQGGAVYLGDSQNMASINELHLIKSTLTGNSALVSGGALFLDNSSLTIISTNFLNNSSPDAALIHMVNFSQSHLDKTTIKDHVNSVSLFSTDFNNTARQLIIDNSIISDNANIDNLFNFNSTEIWIRHTFINHNQVNQTILNKTNSIGFNLDRVFFNTISENSISGSVFNLVNSNISLRNNIIWQTNNSLYENGSSIGDYKCNIVSSENLDFNGIKNTIINPLFIDAINRDFRLHPFSRAIDYCSYENDAGLLLEGDIFDWQHIEDLYGYVDIGALAFTGIIFINSFEN